MRKTTDRTGKFHKSAIRRIIYKLATDSENVLRFELCMFAKRDNHARQIAGRPMTCSFGNV